MGALYSPRNRKLVIKQLHSVKSHVMSALRHTIHSNIQRNNQSNRNAAKTQLQCIRRDTFDCFMRLEHNTSQTHFSKFQTQTRIVNNLPSRCNTAYDGGKKMEKHVHAQTNRLRRKVVKFDMNAIREIQQ